MLSDHDPIDLKKVLPEAYQGVPEPDPAFHAALQARLENELARMPAAPAVTRQLSWFAWTRWVPPVNAVLVAAALILMITTAYLSVQHHRDHQAYVESVQKQEQLEKDVLALIDDLDRPAQARPEWLRAVARVCRQTLAAPGLETPTSRGKLLARLAACEQELGEPAAAVQHYREAVPIWEGLCRSEPDQPEYRRELANCLHQLGVLYRESRQTAQADLAFQQALDAYGRLPERDLLVADTYQNLGGLLGDAGQWADAVNRYSQAIQTLERVPLQDQNWRPLVRALVGRSTALSRLDRRADALRDWDRAVEIANRHTRAAPAQPPKGKPLIWAADAEGGAPYVFADPMNPKKLIGFEVDLAEALARELGRPLEFKQYPYVNLLKGLDAGDFDLAMNGLEITPDRLHRVRFSRPYYVAKLQLVVRADDLRIGSVRDMDGRSDLVIGTLAETAAERQLDRLGVKKKLYEGQLEPFSDLIAGRLDGVLLDVPIANHYAGKHPKLKFAGEPVAPGFYAIAVSSKNEALLPEINYALDRLLRSGELRRIYEKWNLWNADQEGLFNLQGIPQELTDRRAG